MLHMYNLICVQNQGKYWKLFAALKCMWEETQCSFFLFSLYRSETTPSEHINSKYAHVNIIASTHAQHQGSFLTDLMSQTRVLHLSAPHTGFCFLWRMSSRLDDQNQTSANRPFHPAMGLCFFKMTSCFRLTSLRIDVAGRCCFSTSGHSVVSISWTQD